MLVTSTFRSAIAEPFVPWPDAEQAPAQKNRAVRMAQTLFIMEMVPQFNPGRAGRKRGASG